MFYGLQIMVFLLYSMVPPPNVTIEKFKDWLRPEIFSFSKILNIGHLAPTIITSYNNRYFYSEVKMYGKDM